MFNLVRRMPLWGEPNESWSVAALGKVGIGIVAPHAENTIFNANNDVGQRQFRNLVGLNRGWWQVGEGWTTGFEVALRANLWYPFYVEVADKVAYANFYDIPVNQGTHLISG